ncbi:hypothetical protein OROGR_029750 [Orobanche gracilis]
MVWFQCEDCGDNLKKPKLANHFRQCSAFKEKYGPKGQGKATNGTNTKTRNDTRQKPEVDINVGLSERPPWFCSLSSNEKYAKDEVPGNKDAGNQNSTEAAPLSDGSGVFESKSSESNKKRKLEASENGNNTGDDISTEFGKGEIRGSKMEKGSKRAKHSATQENAEVDSADGKDCEEKKIQWKKLITSALKYNRDGAMKLKKLRKFVEKSLKESGFT